MLLNRRVGRASGEFESERACIEYIYLLCVDIEEKGDAEPQNGLYLL